MKVSAAAAVLAVAGAANAAWIDGEISFEGGWQPIDAAFNSTTIEDAVGVEFAAPTKVTETPAPTGDYAGTGGTVVSYTNFLFDPFNAAGVTPLWAFVHNGLDYSFDLLSVAVAFQSSRALVLEGQGVASITGYEDTDYFWTFTGQGGTATFSFSATNVPVPEPSVIGLLGLGLIGFAVVGFLRRRGQVEVASAA
ncbi:MAG: PEP-CTERM sorting domain-containing protein [Aquisalimonadaceae bacterium]